MNTSFECEYEFEEVRIFGEGLMAWGTATLVHDGGGEFYVSDITLTDGTYLNRGGGTGLGSDFMKRLFTRIAIEIENDEHAQDFFQRKLDDTAVEPDGDYLYEQMRDRMMEAAE